MIIFLVSQLFCSDKPAPQAASTESVAVNGENTKPSTEYLSDARQDVDGNNQEDRRRRKVWKQFLNGSKP